MCNNNKDDSVVSTCKSPLPQVFRVKRLFYKHVKHVGSVKSLRYLKLSRENMLVPREDNKAQSTYTTKQERLDYCLPILLLWGVLMSDALV